MDKTHANAVAIRCMDLRKEVSRIANVVLRQDFAIPEDRRYWEDKMKKLNDQLMSLESQGAQP